MIVGLTLIKVSSCSTSVSVPNTMTMTPVTSAIIGTWRVTTYDAVIATTIATIKAPVATNRWNLALAIKKIISGPSSVASLNSGCGTVLFISVLNSCDRLREIPRSERREVVDAFADTDEMHRQLVFLSQGHQNAASRSAVEFCHDEARHPRRAMKRLDLR